MSRTAACGRPEATRRAKVARAYLDVAELAADETTSEARNVAAGNAVLAAIAASDALCCVHLGHRNRTQDHRTAIKLLRNVNPRLADDLATTLHIKDPSHYGTNLIPTSRLKTTIRAATRLVTAAENALHDTPR